MKNRSGMTAIGRSCLCVSALSAIFAFALSNNELAGKWSILNMDGSQSGEYIDFRKDSTYSIILPDGQIGEKGSYLLKDTVFFIMNSKNACGKGYWGKYGLTFHGNDSIHFSYIADTCAERKADIVGYNPGLKRLGSPQHN